MMIDPLGRFFQNIEGYLVFSDSILEIETFEALEHVGWNRKNFLKRVGIYKW